MAFYYNGRKIKASKRAARQVRKYRRKAKKSSFVKRVKKIIHSQVETKCIQVYAPITNIAYAGSVSNPTYINLNPTPVQGGAQGNRLGNQIRITKAHFHGYVCMRPWATALNPMAMPTMVKMWICRRKASNQNSLGAPATADFAQFFQNGSSALGFQSSVVDMLLPINTDYWTVFATKTFTLANQLNPGGATATIVSGNNNSILPFSFHLQKHLGLLRYNDSSTYPTNKELFCVLQTVWADGSTSSSFLTLAQMSYVYDVQFEDA